MVPDVSEKSAQRMGMRWLFLVFGVFVLNVLIYNDLYIYCNLTDIVLFCYCLVTFCFCLLF